jgi:hypothetical protein
MLFAQADRSKLCAACHTDIWESYRKTGMGRSFSQPSPENTPIPAAPFYHAPSESYFTMSARGGEFFQRRHQVDEHPLRDEHLAGVGCVHGANELVTFMKVTLPVILPGCQNILVDIGIGLDGGCRHRAAILILAHRGCVVGAGFCPGPRPGTAGEQQGTACEQDRDAWRHRAGFERLGMAFGISLDEADAVVHAVTVDDVLDYADAVLA